MLLSTFLLVTISLFIVPCFAPSPIVEISEGMTESDAKKALALMQFDKAVLENEVHWSFTFKQEAARMLPYVTHVLSSEPKGFAVKIVAIVSIDGNGGPFFQLMAILKVMGYTNITIIVLYNSKGKKNKDQWADYKAFEKIRQTAQFTTAELFLLKDPKDPNHTYYNYKSLNLEDVKRKLEKVSIVFDGIIGAGHGSTTDYKSTDVLKDALTILPQLCPANTPTEIKILSNATLSGTTEDGTLLDSNGFVGFAILSPAFPFKAINKKKPDSSVNPPQNIILAETMATHPITGETNSFLTNLKKAVPEKAKDVDKVMAALVGISWVCAEAEAA